MPEGLSAWELGTNSGIKAKADEDYEKRTGDSVGVDRASTTFVFATPLTWPGKAAWVQARSDENVWRRVLAFDAEDLLQWMERFPVVAVWFGRITGLAPRSGTSGLHGEGPRPHAVRPLQGLWAAGRTGPAAPSLQAAENEPWNAWALTPTR